VIFFKQLDLDFILHIIKLKDLFVYSRSSESLRQRYRCIATIKLHEDNSKVCVSKIETTYVFRYYKEYSDLHNRFGLSEAQRLEISSNFHPNLNWLFIYPESIYQRNPSIWRICDSYDNLLEMRCSFLMRNSTYESLNSVVWAVESRETLRLQSKHQSRSIVQWLVWKSRSTKGDCGEEGTHKIRNLQFQSLKRASTFTYLSLWAVTVNLWEDVICNGCVRYEHTFFRELTPCNLLLIF